MGDQISSGTDRLRALLSWWGISGYEDRSGISQQFARLQTFVAEVQNAYLDATSRHLDAIFASNDRLARSAYDLLNNGRRSELSMPQAQIVEIVLESAARHARAWAEFQCQVQEIYSALASPSAAKTESTPASTTTPAGERQPPSQSADKKLVNAA